jgi:hypothetical protein
MTTLFVVAALSSLAMIGGTYPNYATHLGWPIGDWAQKNGWYVYHGVAEVLFLFEGWRQGGLVGITIVLVVGFFVAFLITNALRSRSQTLSLMSFPVALLVPWVLPHSG